MGVATDYELPAWRAGARPPSRQFEYSTGKSVASSGRCFGREHPTKRATVWWPRHRTDLAASQVIRHRQQQNSFPWRSRSGLRVGHPGASGRGRTDSGTRRPAEYRKTWGCPGDRCHGLRDEAVRCQDPFRGAGRRDRFVVEILRMGLRGAEEGPFKPPDVFAAHAKFGKLKSQQLQKMSGPREHSHGENLDFFASDDGGDEAVTSHKIFNKGGVRGKIGLELWERKIRRSFERGVFALVRREFAQSPQQFLFMRLGFFLEGFEPLVGFFLGTQLFKLDAVIIP